MKTIPWWLWSLVILGWGFAIMTESMDPFMWWGGVAILTYAHYSGKRSE